jgi:autotransporter-associated beta strand protein
MASFGNRAEAVPERFGAASVFLARWMRALAWLALIAGATSPSFAQNIANTWSGSATGALGTAGNWSLGTVPVVTNDAIFSVAVGTGIRTLTAGTITVGSFNVTAPSGTYSIRNETGTATNSTLTLGGAGNLGNGVSGTSTDLLYAASGSTFNIVGPNGGSGTGTLILALGQNGTFNIAGTSNISSVITGSGFGFTKTGSGTLTLSGNNTYTGTTTLNAGTLRVGNNSTFGTSSVVVNSSSVVIDSAVSTSYTLSNNITLNTRGTIGAGGGNMGNLTFGGIISGTGDLKVDVGTGVISLNGLNTFTGNVVVDRALDANGGLSFNSIANAGVASALGAGSSISLGIFASAPIFTYTGNTAASSNRSIALTGGSATIVSRNGSLTLSGNVTSTTQSLVLQGSAGGGANFNELSGIYSGGGSLSVQSGSGDVWKISGNNTYTGITYSQFSATTIAGHSNAFGSTANGTQVTQNSQILLTGNISVGAEALTLNSGAGGSWNGQNGAALRSYTGNNSWAGAITLGQATTIATNSGAGLTLSGGIGGAFNLVFNSIGDTIASGNITTSTGTLTKSGAGNLTLSGNNTYTGATTISAGMIQIGHASALGVGGNITFGGGGLQYGSGMTVDVSSRLKNSASAILIDTNSNNVTFASALGSTNSAGLTKNGSGTLTLSGNNTYTGATTVSAGTLSMTGVSGYKTTALSVASGATLGITMTGNATSVGANTAGTWTAFNSVSANITGAGVVALNGTNFISAGGSNGTMRTNLSAGGVLDVQSGSWAWGYGRASAATNLGSLNVASGAEFRSSDTAIQFDALTGSGTVANAYNGNITITLGVSNTTNNAAYGVTGNTATFSGVIKGPDSYTGVTTGTLNLVKTGSGTQILSGNNTYTGATTINAGTLKVGSSTGLASGSAVTVNGGFLDLNGFNATVASLGAGNAAGTITNSASGSGTNALSITNYNANLASLITDGATAKTAVTLYNNGGANMLSNANNTFSGGLTIAGNSTRLYQGSVTNTLVNGTLTKSNLGTGTIYMGANGSVVSAQMQLGSGSVYNNIIFNAIDYGDGGRAAFRIDGTVAFYGTLTAGASDISLSGQSTGAATAYGQLTGTNGLMLKTPTSAGIFTLTLNNTANAANNYSGNTTISANTTLALGAADQIANGVGKGNLIVNSGNFTMGGYSETINGLSGNGTIDGVSGTPTLTVGDNDATSTFSGVIKNTAGSLGLTKTGNGTLTLSGDNTYSGATTVSAGTLSLTGNLSGGSAISVGGASVFTQGSASIISGTSSFTQNSSGTSTLAGANTYTGATTISAGTLEIAATGLLGGGNYSSNIANNGTLLVGSNSNQNLTGIISGTGALTKNGSGTMTISRENTYNGATTINAGTLVVSGNISSSALTINSGAVISPGSTADAKKITTSALTINGGGYNWTIANGSNYATAGIDYDQIASTGVLTLNNTEASPFTVYVYGDATGWNSQVNKTWNIMTAGSITGFNAGNFSINFDNFGIAAENRAGATWSFATAGGNLTLAYTLQTPNYYWDGASGNWSDSYVPNTRGFNPGPPENDKNIFLTGSGGTVTNNIANGTLTSLGFITFNSTAGAYTLAANAGSSGASGGTALTVLGDVTNNSVNAQTINLAMAFTGSSSGTINAAAGNITIGGVLSGSGALTKTGGNTLVLSASNSYSGGTTLRNGTLAINNATAIGTGALTIVSGTLGNTSGANITLSNNNAQNWNGDFSFNSTKDLNMGTGAVTMNASRTVTVAASNFTVGGIISGSGHGLTKNGSGTMILSGANTYTGATTINAGTLTANGGSAIADASAVSVGSGAVFNLGASETVGSIAGAGNISLGFFTLTAGGDNSSTTASGVISGTGALTKTGTGALTLSGANTYNGTTTVSAGTLKAGSITGISSNSALNVASGATLDLAGYNSTILGLSSTTTNGTITNSGSLAQLTISKAFGQNSTAGTTAQLFTGNLSIQLFGGGTTDSLLTNTSNTYSGGTTFGNGSGTTTTRIFTGGGTIGAGSPGAVTSGRYGTGTITLGAAITDRVQFYFDGGATINNAIVVNTAAGTDNSSDIGAFRAETSGIVLAGSINANLADAMFSATNGSGRAISVTGAISGNSGVTVRTSGSGGLNVTLNATANANTYSGNTTINTANSTLTLGKSDQIANGVGKGNLIINSGTFAMGGFSDTINGLSGNGTIDGNGSTLTVGDNNTTSTFSGVMKNTAGNLALTKTGNGTLTLSGNSTHTGATTVNAGTLTVSGNISTSASTIASGATLDGAGRVGAVTVSGTMAGTLTTANITVSSGGLLSPSGNGSVGTISAGNITLSAGSGYAWTLADATGLAGTGFDQVTGTGALTMSNTAASPFTVYVFGNATNWSGNTTSWNIISAASQTGFSTGNFAINVASFGVASANRTGTWSFTNPSGGNITLNYTVAGADSIWAGTTGVWSGNFTPGVSTDKNITFTGAGGTATNDIASGTLSSVNFITFNSTAGAYTLAANAGSSGNGTALTVLGDIINNSSNATGQTISMALALGSTSTGIVNTAAGNITISGVISGAGALTKTGSSTLTLNATNTFTGAVVINAGTLATGSAGLLADTANVTINSGGNYTVGAADTIASISGSGDLRLNAALTMGTSTFSGNISGASAIAIYSGTLNFSGNNTNWSGGITGTGGNPGMNGAVFIAGADNAFGNGTITGGINPSISIRSSDATDRTLANSISRRNSLGGSLIFGSAGTGNLTIQGGYSSTNDLALVGIQVDNTWTQINGAVASAGTTILTKTGTGTLILNGNNTYAHSTTISAGTLQIGASGRLGGGSYSGNIAINGLTSAFVYAGNNNQTLTGLISGNGVFTKNGSGMLTINASNTIGAKTVNGGTLRIVGAGGVGGIGASNSTVNLNNGSTLQLGFTGASNNVYSGGVVNIDSTGGATVANDGLNGLIQFGGWFTINTNGGAQSQLTSLNGGYYNDQTANGGLILNVASGSNATADLLLAVGGSYAITKNGTGKVLVTASPTLRGITINNGVLEFGGSSTPTFSASLAFTNNGTFSYNSTASSTISQNITGTGNLTKSNNSTLTLSGAGTNYSGLTTVDAGTLAISNNMTIGAITGAGNMTLGSGFTLTTNSTTNSTFSGVISSSGALMKNGTSTLTLSGNNTYSGGTTINAGTLEIASTGLLGGGNYSGNIVNNGALLIASNSNQILSGAISGIGALTKNGTGTLTLSGSNSYSGGTTLNTGTLNINNATALGTATFTIAGGTIDNTSGAAITLSSNNTQSWNSDFTFTGTNDLNLGTGAVAMNNSRVINVAAGNLTVGGVISGSNRGITKNGNGTLILSGANTYTGTTTVNSGTLEAANAGALGSTVQVNGGTLLVTADDAINGMTVTLNSTSTTVAGLAFNGTYSGLVDNLTLSKNSIIDLGDGSVSIMFDTFVMSTYTLDIYNWTGTTLWGGGTGNDTDKVYFGDDLSDEALAKIYFHSGAVGGGDSFLGSGYDLGLQQTSWDSGLEGYHIIPVPEPETYATGLLLLLGGAWWMWKRKPKAV